MEDRSDYPTLIRSPDAAPRPPQVAAELALQEGLHGMVGMLDALLTGASLPASTGTPSTSPPITPSAATTGRTASSVASARRPKRAASAFIGRASRPTEGEGAWMQDVEGDGEGAEGEAPAVAEGGEGGSDSEEDR